MTTHAKGTFEVKLTPQPSDDNAADASLGRMSIEKQFHGDLEATSTGQMLTAGTAVKARRVTSRSSGPAERCMAAAEPLYSSTLAP